MRTPLPLIALGLLIAGCSFDGGGLGLHLDGGDDLGGLGGAVAGDPVDASPGDPWIADAAVDDDDDDDDDDGVDDGADAGATDPPDPQRCGDADEACCEEGPACEDGTECTEGTCRSCGGVFESCCDPGASCSGFAVCIAGGCV